MLKNLIGDKKIFAIEYSIISVKRSTALGDCLIWLQGNSLGGLDTISIRQCLIVCSARGSVKERKWVSTDVSGDEFMLN
jgi:hypothetical protein